MGSPLRLSRSLTRSRWGLENVPTVSPWATRSRVRIWAVEPLPLVPVMWMAGAERCGSPMSPTSRSMRSVDGDVMRPVSS